MSKSVAAHDTGLIASASNLPTRCRQQCSLVVATVRGPSCDPTNTAIARTRCRPVGRCAAWCRILGWHPQRGPVPVHPGRVRQRCSSHGKLEPVRPDTSRFTGLKAADGITAPAARTKLPRAGIRPASGHRSEAPQREGSDGPSCHPAQFTDMQRQCQEVNGCDRPCASPSRHFLAKPSVCCDRGDHLRVLLPVAMTMLRIAPLSRQPAITANDPQRRTLIRRSSTLCRLPAPPSSGSSVSCGLVLPRLGSACQPVILFDRPLSLDSRPARGS
jgi:hypothetical protein